VDYTKMYEAPVMRYRRSGYESVAVADEEAL
jgi:hypothetical protein